MPLGCFCIKLFSLIVFGQLEENIAVPQNKHLASAVKLDLCNTEENIP